MSSLLQDGGCVPHIPVLKRLGYIPLVRDTPVNISDIPKTSWYRHHVEGENCCGSKEFIKLYAYTLTDYPVVVHWDLDVAVLQPLDDLFDAMIFPASSKEGRAARRNLAIQQPYHQKLPEQIDAFFTRDITSARPWEEITAIQGGFVVARPSMEHFELYKEFILEANYTAGRGPGSGWGGLGYGGFQVNLLLLCEIMYYGLILRFLTHSLFDPQGRHGISRSVCSCFTRERRRLNC